MSRLIAVIHLRCCCRRETENWTIDVFGFIPKRYDSTLLDIAFPGGDRRQGLDLRHLFAAAPNLSHIGFNVLWFAAFGSALARRFGAVRFSSSWR